VDPVDKEEIRRHVAFLEGCMEEDHDYPAPGFSELFLALDDESDQLYEPLYELIGPGSYRTRRVPGAD